MKFPGVTILQGVEFPIFPIHFAWALQRFHGISRIKLLTENVAIAMHCNLRPPDVAPVVLRFNCEANTKYKVGEVNYPFLTYNVFTAHILRYAVTLTFDPLTCDVWAVT